MRSSNNLTVALDVVRHQYLCAPTDAADPRMNELRHKSYRGDQTLLCALCYAGIGTAPGSEVPVIVKGRIGGVRRPHFAHPAGHGPTGGQHEPESEWHLASKECLAAWARTQPDVIDVRNEVWLPNRERRSDVRVTFANGDEVALEAQCSPLTDTAWTSRHHDYQLSGVIDVWLWHPDSPVPWVILSDTKHPQQLWMLDPWKGSITLMVGAPHQHQPIAAHDINHRIQHLPPCTGDELAPYEFSLSDMTLTPHGIEIPAELSKQLAEQQEQERRRLQAVENARKQSPQPNAPARLPTALNPSGNTAGEIEGLWPAIREKARQLGGGTVYALLAGVWIARLEEKTVVLAHQHAPLRQRLMKPTHVEALHAAVREVLGREYEIRWETAAPLQPPAEKSSPRRASTQSAQRFDIRAAHVEDFDSIFDLLQLAGASYSGGNREFVVEHSTFTFAQVWALIELARHPELPTVETLWRPQPRE
ncbi:competence protein CoiA family protein [Nocardia ninae]|uniref:Competence protein CoiA nuclease-like domain-containing protein n=2 Tax=Nocardia ninae TaxID=356145 RepID=A0A511MC46_9NOCA|nr:hypothetical protein NN4_26780 [Nocardia ninae NBRC 108245]